MKITNETKVGALTAVAIIILILGYNLLRGNDIFSKNIKLYAVYDRVDQLTISKPVYLNGFQIGRVDDLSINAQGKIVARLDISKDVNIPRNSIAKISSLDLLGSKGVVLIRGNDFSFAKSGDTLISEIDKSLTESFNPVKDQAEAMLGKIDSILTAINSIMDPGFQRNVNTSVERISQTLTSFQKITSDLAGQTERLKFIFANVESITTNLKNNNQKITSLLNNLDEITDQVAKANIKDAVLNANKALADFADITAKIQNGQGSMGKLLNDDRLYNNLAKSAEDLDKLLIDVKANPKRYVSFSVFGGGGGKKKEEKVKEEKVIQEIIEEEKLEQ